MKISIIIPCYNGEEFIGQTLGSVYEQSRPPDEIIVVDDGSTDRSAETARSFGERITVLSKGGGGAANARNFGADFATGDALMFLDADDVLGPDVLKNLVKQLEKNPDGVVACPWYRLDKVGDKWVQRPPSFVPLGKNQDYLSGWITGWYHLPCSILWSRAAYKSTGGWDPRAYVNDDGDLMMRALADGVNLQITNKGSSFYRRMPEEKISSSLSGARFTRAGREAQIYVLHKIAQRLDERGKLHKYRKALTIAFTSKRALCQPEYPDLSKKCTDLINQYGEPRLTRILRKISGRFRHYLYISRKYLSGVKNKISSAVADKKERPGKNGLEKEIRYGLSAYRKAMADEKKGKILKPSRPHVSVIIPVNKQTESLDRAVNSVINQTFGSFELLVVGAGAGNDKADIMEQFTDSRIKNFSISRQMELAAVINRGLREVKGDYVAFLDPNDEWFEDKLEKQMELFRNVSESVGLIYAGCEIVGADKKKSHIQPESKVYTHRELLLRNVIPGISGVMIRRTVIAGAGFFDESVSAFSLQDYWLRISRFYQFDFIEEPLFRQYKLVSNRPSF